MDNAVSESVASPDARSAEPAPPPPSGPLHHALPDAADAVDVPLAPLAPVEPAVIEPPRVPRSGSGVEVLAEFRRVARRGVRGVHPAGPAGVAPERAVAGDALHLATGHLGLIALLARVGGVLALDSVLVAVYGHEARPAVWATAPVLAWSLLLVVPGRRLDPTLPAVRVADLLLALLAVFLVQAYAPEDILVLPGALGVVMLGSAVGAWSAAAGAVGAAVPILLDVPVQAGAVEAAYRWRHVPLARAVIIGGAQLAALVLIAVLSFGAIAAVALALRRAARVAYDAGATAAQVGLRRNLHDTVLPTLEAIALPVRAGDDPRSELSRVRTAARAQATRLRHVLDTRQRARPAVVSLRDLLAAAGADGTVGGLSVELVLPEPGPDPLTPPQRQALCDAAREALRNVRRHAGVSSAVLLLDVQPDQVRVVVRDHGCGIAPGRPAGFGMSQSIRARVAEVGGRAEFWSAPGRGTRVTLSVPLRPVDAG